MNQERSGHRRKVLLTQVDPWRNKVYAQAVGSWERRKTKVITKQWCSRWPMKGRLLFPRNKAVYYDPGILQDSKIFLHLKSVNFSWGSFNAIKNRYYRKLRFALQIMVVNYNYSLKRTFPNLIISWQQSSLHFLHVSISYIL